MADLSQEEIDALLNAQAGGGSDASPSVEDQGASSADLSGLLSDMERDALGEIGNISMGSAATTLSVLLGHKVNITTPSVHVDTMSMIQDQYPLPYLVVEVGYVVGINGNNVLAIQASDACIIADLMMGGDGLNPETELGEIHMSAVGEAMNQMMGSSATSLSSMLGRMIDISPPEASVVNLLENKNGADIAPFLAGDFVKIESRMQIEDLVDSTIMQLYPIDFAKSLYEIFMGQQMGTSAAPAQPEPQPTPQPEPQPYIPPQAEVPQMQQAMPQTQQAMPQMQQAMPQMQMPPMQQANVQPAQFQAFNTQMPQQMASQENIGLIMDVPLEVTVELGRTKKSIAEILDFTPGTIIELDKIAGEPNDVLVNGKFVAKGEVVVIEENFGIRVTEIIK